jgi:hypothetical protein
VAGCQISSSRCLHVLEVRLPVRLTPEISHSKAHYRFISPAVVAPESVDVEIPKNDGGVIRRGLMVIAKIIQNLANNIYFGKEAYMVSLNDFLHAHIAKLTRYLNDLQVITVDHSSDNDSYSFLEIFLRRRGR